MSGDAGCGACGGADGLMMPPALTGRIHEHPTYGDCVQSLAKRVAALEAPAAAQPAKLGVALPCCTTCGDSGWSIDDESNRRRCHCGARRL